MEDFNIDGYAGVPTIKFLDYPHIAELYQKLVAMLSDYKYKTRNIPYNKRVDLLRQYEDEYERLYKFSKSLQEEAECHEGDSRYNRYYAAALEKYNFVKVKEGKFHDFVISAPPLGERLIGNNSMLCFLTDLAIKALEKRGHKFITSPDHACVIVKQYCHCEEVAMGTVENREVHIITDTVVQHMKLDDNMWFVDFCYVWCESDEPRTEIIVTDKKYVKQYSDFCHELYEDHPGDKKREYNVTYQKKEKLVHCLRNIADILEKVNGTVPVFAYGFLDHDACMDLVALLRSFEHIISSLREPFISGVEHKYSRLYSKNSKGIFTRKRNGEEKLDELRSYAYKLSNMCSTVNDELTIKTFSPYSAETESGYTLCMEQQQLIQDTAARYHHEDPLSLERDGDVVVQIDRYADENSSDYADNDNINTMFLNNNYDRRAKVIYVKTVKVKELDSRYNCVIHVVPEPMAVYP